MPKADAIKSKKDVERISEFFLKHKRPKVAYLFKLGINVALRITDLLNVKFEHIQGNQIKLVEQKTGKTRTITLNAGAESAINSLRVLLPDAVYLFESTGNRGKATPKPISRQYVSSQFKEAEEALELNYTLATHSMRKTWGYWRHQEKAVPMGVLMKTLGHSSEAVTLAYIGLTDDDIEATYHEVVL